MSAQQPSRISGLPTANAGSCRIQLWRRACFAAVLVIATAVLSPGPIWGAEGLRQYELNESTLVWRTHFNKEFKYRIELPGDMENLVENMPDGLSQEHLAELMFDRMTIAIRTWEARGRRPMAADESMRMIQQFARAMELTYGVAPKVSSIILDGSHGREDIFSFKDTVMHHRTYAHGGRIIQLMVSYSPQDPVTVTVAQRVLASLSFATGQ